MAHVKQAADGGLDASIWTKEFAQAHRLSRALRVGIVSINASGSDRRRDSFWEL
ncbi:aldehyde dehydrogenase family protein [Mesorhizobium sp. M0118]|uniref:aldehyde dehydrogenase family protein n=1 Tax=Mesorhizobium sp. M0118 TaxID=2956884 RepID=UPI003338215F